MKKRLLRSCLAALTFLAACEPPKYQFHCTGGGEQAVLYRCDPMTGEAWVALGRTGWSRLPEAR